MWRVHMYMSALLVVTSKNKAYIYISTGDIFGLLVALLECVLPYH